jgi:hypothetical protein
MFMRLDSIALAFLLLFGLLSLCITFDSVHSNDSGDYWGVLLEMNEFPVGWSDLPVNYIDNERMKTTLLSLGWQDDHIYTVNGTLTEAVVQEAIEWLKNRTDTDDVALLYIFTHGNWMRNVLQWNSWFPNQWTQLNCSKILMIDTCFAEEFLEQTAGDPDPHISLGCCSADEVSWAGLEEEGLPIIGSVWNYYFTNALCNSSADINGDEIVSVEEAFNFSTPLVQKYMNETVFTVPEFLESYHDIGIYPELYDEYPHPVMDDKYPVEMAIPEFSNMIVLSLLMTIVLLIAVVKKKLSLNLRN